LVGKVVLDLLLLRCVVELLSYNKLFVSDFIACLVICRNNALNCGFSATNTFWVISNNKDVLLVFFFLSWRIGCGPTALLRAFTSDKDFAA
jgi:hypothetical protein